MKTTTTKTTGKRARRRSGNVHFLRGQIMSGFSQKKVMLGLLAGLVVVLIEPVVTKALGSVLSPAA
jgi:hypothetical protein